LNAVKNAAVENDPLDGDDDLWSSLVSVDDHVVEPKTLWHDRLSRDDRGRGPRVVRMRVRDAVKEPLTGLYVTPELEQYADDWVDMWRYEDVRFPIMRSFASAGFAEGDVDAIPVIYDDMRPGCYEVSARLADMSEDGVAVSLCFPNLFVRFCGQRFLEAKDKDLALRCVRAYNDWLTEEWAGPSGGRLHGAYILPLWDPALAAAEVERVAQDARAVCFSEIPPRLGLPSIYTGDWDPLFAACERTDTVVAMHIGSSSSHAVSSDDAPKVLRQGNHHTISSLSLTDWLVSGVLDRFPALKIAFAEGQAGWMPYLVSRLDRLWHRNSPALYKGDVARTPDPPSSYLGHVHSCVFDDPTAMRLLDLIGVDNICFETDYPHPDGTWPDSRANAREQTKDLSPEVRRKILRDNGLRLLGLA
jgi:predicted TIM-barrel fold metal-dependent hydrolase